MVNPPPNANATSNPGRWWTRPPLLALSIAAALLVLALAWSAWQVRTAPPGPAPTNLPWQVQRLPDGASEVFGLVPGRTTVAEVSQRFANDLRLALVVSANQPPALEAYVESFQAGFVNGKLVLAFAAEPGWLTKALARSPRRELAGDGTARRHALAEADLAQAQGLPLAALAFLPAARLDEMTVAARFGPPAERLAGAQGELQLLYPALGLAVTLPPAEGDLARARPVLQYVAPREFEQRLRAPLVGASGPAAR